MLVMSGLIRSVLGHDESASLQHEGLAIASSSRLPFLDMC